MLARASLRWQSPRSALFGDIGTSPLYTLKSCFDKSGANASLASDVLGIASLLVWTLVVVVCLRYVTFIMQIDHDGEGGILALLARAIPPSLDGAPVRFGVVTVIVIVGAAMLLGDGAITPAISVISPSQASSGYMAAAASPRRSARNRLRLATSLKRFARLSARARNGVSNARRKPHCVYRKATLDPRPSARRACRPLAVAARRESDGSGASAFAPNLTRIVATFGYMEPPRIAPVIAAARAQGLEPDREDTSFFYADPKIEDSSGGDGSFAQRAFVMMQRSARPLPDDLGIPAERCIERSVCVVYDRPHVPAANCRNWSNRNASSTQSEPKQRVRLRC